MQHKGVLLRDGKSVMEGTFDIQEVDEPTRKPIGFRARPPAPPTMAFSFFFESPSVFKNGDILRLKLNDGREADVAVDRVSELMSDLYKIAFILKSALK